MSFVFGLVKAKVISLVLIALQHSIEIPAFMNKFFHGFKSNIPLIFFLHTTGNDDFSQLSNDRVIPDNNSNEYGFPCTYCQQQFEQCVGEIAAFSPILDPNLQSPLYSQHSRHLYGSREDFQHSRSDQNVHRISLHEQSPFEEGDVSMSFLKPYRHWSSSSNMASIEGAREDVAMETSGTPPLRALKSLCGSISPDIVPVVSTSRGALSIETYPSCTRISDQLVLDSVFQKARSCRLIPQTPPSSCHDLSPVQAPESHRLWRPWIA